MIPAPARSVHGALPAFALNPKSRAAIERYLRERTTIRGICRALQVSPNTVYATFKNARL